MIFFNKNIENTYQKFYKNLSLFHKNYEQNTGKWISDFVARRNWE